MSKKSSNSNQKKNQPGSRGGSQGGHQGSPKKDMILSIAKNKKALHDYEIIKEIETGVVLTGSELKSVRKREVNLKGSYAIISPSGELIAKQIHIKEYQQASYLNHDPKRDRVLLAHKKEIANLLGQLKKSRGTTLIPIEIYFKNKWVKLRLGLGVGRKHHDKRQHLKEQEQKREMDRFSKNFS